MKRLFRGGLVALVATSLFLLGHGAPAIDYEPFGLECLLMASDAVVIADVPQETSGSVYDVNVTGSIRGGLASGKLQISEPAKFRGTPPDFTSNEALLFLKQVNGDRWEVLGPSGEGRVQLSPSEADVTAIRLPVSTTSTRYPRAELLAALRKASCCFMFERTTQGVNAIRRCDPSFRENAAGSDLTTALLRVLQDPNRRPCSPL